MKAIADLQDTVYTKMTSVSKLAHQSSRPALKESLSLNCLLDKSLDSNEPALLNTFKEQT